ncbi:MAG: hypothetical protein A3F70_12475 [Acidobacteria bacterium RIFCSPLOWO2_12_FULL_67_14]|nr:MAG: hypothetical protein A3H29_17870 [Acidobacteria bacterium RIFCSPLOWO2_02_FULL_67_21]OFW36194.1 MAG: hypothetical protein A3F70_12475 [Acidobacteria bacterium RIFCSPLOWO2_12_FULL_67_14]
MGNAVQTEAVELRVAEFAALRRTISARGTARMVIAPVTTAVWAILTLVLFLLGQLPLATLLPLTVLVGGFEAIHALHVGAERIGRYIQVHYEAAADGPRWETAAMTVGPSLPGGGIDPLFSAVFIGAALINAATAFDPPPTWQELAIVLAAHAAFVVRVTRARRAASRQRAVELESFKALLSRDGER